MEGRGRERERNIDVREKHLLAISLHTPPLGNKSKTQACALTRNQTRDLLVHGTTLQPTEPHWPGLKSCVLYLELV